MERTMRERGFAGGRDGRDGGRSVHGGRAGGRRGSRGDVRAAALALLAERPMHGYEMLAELSRRTREVWRPSPGSLYPALQLLEDQGLVRSATEHGRRRFELTVDGRALQEQNKDGAPPWETIAGAVDEGALAVSQVAEAGTPEQQASAVVLLTELRRRLYLLLAGPSVPDGFERKVQ
jgi:DNA-binding PadR family transcriptional regulator